ncbi:MAG TPA: hypothetical protein VG722_10335, partial [Tepidisphaeraceae bacterium]|nr:hypothetical protein [Tepidisphaeraceae bacterium]
MRNSTDVASKLALSDRMVRLEQWDTAADTLQEIIEKSADGVVPTAVDRNGQPTQYVGAVWAAQERLAKWPGQGLSVYRNKFSATATAMLKQAG